MSLLIAGLVRLLIFVFFEMPLFAVVEVMRLVGLAFVEALLIFFVLRIILCVILEKWSASSLCHHPSNTHACRYH